MFLIFSLSMVFSFFTMELSFKMDRMSDLSADLMSKSRYSDSSIHNTPPSSPKSKGKIFFQLSGKDFYYLGT